MFAVAWLMLRGRFGRSLRAVRDSELAAASSGVNLARYKTLAFGISAFYAGVAGSLLAIATTFVNPDTFPVALSIFLLVGVVVGGLGSLWPLVFGAIFIHFMQIEWAQRVEARDPELLPLLGDIDTDAPGAPAVAFGVDPDPDHARVPRRRGGPASAAPASARATTAVLPIARVAKARPARPRWLALRSRRRDRRAAQRATIRGSRDRRSCSAARRRSPARRRRTRGRPRRGRVLQVRQRARRRQRPHDRLQGRRRRLQPVQTVQATRQLVEQDKVFAIFNVARDRAEPGDPRLPERGEGAAALRRLGRDDVRARLQAVSVDDRLPAELPGRGLDLRQVLSPRTKPGAKVAVLFQNDDYGKDLLAGLRAGHRALEGAGRRGAAVRGDRARRAVADREAEGVGRERARALRDAAVRDPGLRVREPARLAAADHQPPSAATHDRSSGSRGGRTRSRSPSSRIRPTPKWRDDAAMKLYRTIMARYAKGANAKDVYHVYGMAVAYETVKVLKAAGKNPTRAAVVAQTAEAERRVEPVPAARDRGQDERDRALPDRAGAAAALVEGTLEELRRALGVLGGRKVCRMDGAARGAARRAARGGARAAARRAGSSRTRRRSSSR